MLQLFGQFHPAVIHFPVALLLVAMISELASWVLKKPALHEFGAWNLHLGAASAVVASAMGWALATVTDVAVDLRPTLFWHRWTGTGAAVWAIITLAAWYRHRAANNAGSIGVYRATLLIGGVLIGVTGHLGGVLIYGLDYYIWSPK